MLRVLDFLFFCFICLLALMGNLPGSQQASLTRQVYRAGFMLGICLYFVLLSVVVSAAVGWHFPLRQTWLNTGVLALSFLVFTLGFPGLYNRKQRALLVLQQYAPTVEKNKTLYPFAAVVVFGVSFMLLIRALSHFLT